MRQSLTCIALSCLLLAGCGGGDEVGGPSMLQSVAATISGNSHSCDQPAPSGSPEQVACHKAAEAACPIGTSPDRVDFSEQSGEFLVKGYSCV